MQVCGRKVYQLFFSNQVHSFKMHSCASWWPNILEGELSMDLNRIHSLVSTHKGYNIDAAIPKIYFFFVYQDKGWSTEKMRSGSIDGGNLAGKGATWNYGEKSKNKKKNIKIKQTKRSLLWGRGRRLLRFIVWSTHICSWCSGLGFLCASHFCPRELHIACLALSIEGPGLLIETHKHRAGKKLAAQMDEYASQHTPMSWWFCFVYRFSWCLAAARMYLYYRIGGSIF